MKAFLAVCIALFGAASAGLLHPVGHLARVPSLDSAVVHSSQVGGNFAYSTAENHAYAGVVPAVHHVATHVAAPVAAHHTVVAHGPAVVAAHHGVVSHHGVVAPGVVAAHGLVAPGVVAHGVVAPGVVTAHHSVVSHGVHGVHHGVLAHGAHHGVVLG